MTGDPRTRRRTGAALGAALVPVLVVLTACGSSGSPGPTSSSASPTPSTSSATPSATTGEPTASDTAPTSSDPATSTPPTAGGSTPQAPACRELSVSVTRVPGAAGVTYALVSVTNTGTTVCALPGVPSLRLLDEARAPLTGAATADGSGGGIAVDPGATASTLLQDRSATCQASTRSTYVEVVATPEAAAVVAELALPPCSLSVKPFTPGTTPDP